MIRVRASHRHGGGGLLSCLSLTCIFIFNVVLWFFEMCVKILGPVSKRFEFGTEDR